MLRAKRCCACWCTWSWDSAFLGNNRARTLQSSIEHSIQGLGLGFLHGAKQIQPAAALFVACGVIVSAFVIMWASRSHLPTLNPYVFTVVFDDVSGVVPGVPVRMNGVEVGKVSWVKGGLASVAVGLEVSNAATLIPTHSMVELTHSGLFSQPFIDISTGAAAASLQKVSHTASTGVGIKAEMDETLESDMYIRSGDTVAGALGGSLDDLNHIVLKLVRGEHPAQLRRRRP